MSGKETPQLLVHLCALSAPALHAVTIASLANPFTEIINSLGSLASLGLDWLYRLTHSYGWSMMLLALGVSLLLLPLSLQALRSMTEAQALSPYLKRLQTRYKNDRQKLAEEQMKLYKEHGVNPLGGCLPMLAQYPFLLAVYRAIYLHNTAFQNAGWLWVGSSLSHQFPKWLATSLLPSFFQPVFSQIFRTAPTEAVVTHFGSTPLVACATMRTIAVRPALSRAPRHWSRPALPLRR